MIDLNSLEEKHDQCLKIIIQIKEREDKKNKAMLEFEKSDNIGDLIKFNRVQNRSIYRLKCLYRHIITKGEE